MACKPGCITPKGEICYWTTSLFCCIQTFCVVNSNNTFKAILLPVILHLAKWPFPAYLRYRVTLWEGEGERYCKWPNLYYRTWFWLQPFKKDNFELKKVQKRETNIVRGWEHLRLYEVTYTFASLQLGGKSDWDTHIRLTLKHGTQKVDKEFLFFSHSTRTRGHSSKPIGGRFRMDQRRYFLTSHINPPSPVDGGIRHIHEGLSVVAVNEPPGLAAVCLALQGCDGRGGSCLSFLLVVFPRGSCWITVGNRGKR